MDDPDPERPLGRKRTDTINADFIEFPGVRRVQYLVRRVMPKALILLYHRVSASPSAPQLLCVSPGHFSEHMQVLRDHYHPLRLMDLQKRRAFNGWLPRSVVITFDDGYADNFQQARPILESQDMPATIFVATGGMDSQREFWWDELERIFLLHPLLPPHLEIRVKGQEYVWELDSANLFPTPTSWNVLSGEMNARQHVYMALMGIFHQLDFESRDDLLSELFAWADIPRSPARRDHLAVRADELKTLPKDGLLEIGAHTINHVSLSALPLEAQRTEINQGKVALEEMLERPILSFAYPYGERRDYTPETIRLVQQAGFSCACSNFTGHVTALSDPYQLPRYIVRDWDGETFARRLEEWFRG